MLVTKFASYVLIISTAYTGFPSLASAACSRPGSPFSNSDVRATIQSPGFPTHYYGNEQCDWFLNPPYGTLPGILIMDLVVNTNVDGIPEAQDVCTRTKNYVDIANVRACGKEGPVCVAFMLQHIQDISCHRTLMKYFGHCQSVLTAGWPLKVSFNTEQPDDKLGFQMNYTFVECGANLDQTEPITKDPAVTKPEASGDGTTSTTTTARTTTTMAKTERTVATKRKTEPTVSPKFTTLKSIQETVKPAGHNTNLILIIVLALLCVIFLIIVIAVIFRKRLRAWVTEKPPSHEHHQMNGSPNGSNVHYTDAYIIPIDKEHTCEQPMATNQPPETQQYRPLSTSTDTSNSTGYDRLNVSTNENNNGQMNQKDCAGTIENCTYDTIQT